MIRKWMKARHERKMEAWRLEIMRQQLGEAHRWLSEFDWLLEPFWKYMFDHDNSRWNGISNSRDEIRKRFEEFKRDLMGKKDRWDELEEENRQLRHTIDSLSSVARNIEEKRRKRDAVQVEG